MFDRNKALAAQAEYCEKHNVVNFAPAFDGECFHCGRNIYEPYNHGRYTSGITVEQAGSRHITSCPHCSYSFVD